MMTSLGFLACVVKQPHHAGRPGSTSRPIVERSFHTRSRKVQNYDNQITSISSGTTPTYDADGNMTTDQTGLIYTYNARGQEVDVHSGDTLEENYTYDGLGDRMTNTVYTDDVGTTTNFYNSAAGQVLEEQAAGTGYYTTRYVWSINYINQMVSRDTDTSGTGLTASGDSYARLWPVADGNFNTVALVAMSDDTATVVERYSYDPFGTVTYMNGSYTVEDGSSYGWVYLFQGGRLDTIDGDTHFGARNEDSALGVWTSEDSTGFKGGNVVLYGFEANSTIAQIDLSGLAEFKIGGYIFYVHPSDPDPLPSKPHAHIGSPNSPTKVDINTGEVFKNGKATGAYLPKKLLRTRNLLTSLFRRNGTVVPCGEFIVEDDPHGLFVVLRGFLAGRVFAVEQMNRRC